MIIVIATLIANDIIMWARIFYFLSLRWQNPN